MTALQFLGACIVFVTRGVADSMIEPRQLNTMGIKTSLASQLVGNASEARLVELVEALRPTYVALLKGEQGYLEQQEVRYLLHRLFVQQHRWHIKGLEPSDADQPPYLHGELMPEYLQGLLMERLRNRGLNLYEIAALAAALENLVHDQVVGKLKTVYDILRVSINRRITGKTANEILQIYLMAFLRGGDVPQLTPDELEEEKRWYASEYEGWPMIEDWFRNIVERHTTAASDQGIEFASMSRVVIDISQEFGTPNDFECGKLKSSLLGMEDRKIGYISWWNFLKLGRSRNWLLNEEIGYLRAIGALDESSPHQPLIIVPNYLNVQTNCLEASSLHAVCCRSECDELMGHLEHALASPLVDPHQISELLVTSSPLTMQAPRNLSAFLFRDLERIAAINGGKVRLHGHHFAQWMHRAFPRACPLPEEPGKVRPRMPDNRIRGTEGDKNLWLSDEEVAIDGAFLFALLHLLALVVLHQRLRLSHPYSRLSSPVFSLSYFLI